MLKSEPRRRDVQLRPLPCGVPVESTGEDFACHRKRNARPPHFSPAACAISRLRRRWRSPTAPGSSRPQGIDVIDLGGGDPDFITPEHIRAAATEAMNAGDTHYVASAGIPGSAQGDRRQASRRQRHRGRPQRRRHRHPGWKTGTVRSDPRLCRARRRRADPGAGLGLVRANGRARRRHGRAGAPRP